METIQRAVHDLKWSTKEGQNLPNHWVDEVGWSHVGDLSYSIICMIIHHIYTEKFIDVHICCDCYGVFEL